MNESFSTVFNRFVHQQCVSGHLPRSRFIMSEFTNDVQKTEENVKIDDEENTKECAVVISEVREKLNPDVTDQEIKKKGLVQLRKLLCRESKENNKIIR